MKKEPEHVDDFRGDADLLFPSKYLKGVDRRPSRRGVD